MQYNVYLFEWSDGDGLYAYRYNATLVGAESIEEATLLLIARFGNLVVSSKGETMLDNKPRIIPSILSHERGIIETFSSLNVDTI